MIKEFWRNNKFKILQESSIKPNEILKKGSHN